MRSPLSWILALSFFFIGCQSQPANEATTVQIHLNDRLGEIDPNIYGHFTELTLTSFEGGVHAEMLVNRKFAEPEQLERFPYPRSGTGLAWEALSVDTDIILHLDKQIYYSAPFSQRLTISAEERGPAGIKQKGYHKKRGPDPFQLKSGEPYSVRIALKQQNLQGPVTVALGNSPDDTVASHSFNVVGEDWAVYQSVLVPSADAPDAAFMVYIDSPGTAWVDSVSLTRTNQTVDGFRKDAIDLTKTITPTSIRYPGGCFADDYHWQDGIGPVDQRPAVYNRAWKEHTTNDVGIAEFVTMCRLLGAEPYICVNYGTGTPEEAAAWVEYCNGGPDTAGGKLRAKHGYEKPFNVRYWNVGNEIYLPTEFGASNGRLYGRGFRRFAEAMRAVDPELHIVAVGTFDRATFVEPFKEKNPLAWQLVRYQKDWTRRLLEEAGEQVDSISIHYYEPQEVKQATSLQQVNQICMAVAEDLGRKLDGLYKDISRYAPQGKHIPIALDEWANWVRGGPQPPPPDFISEMPSSPEQLSAYGTVETLRKALAQATIMNLKQQRPADFSVGSVTLLYQFLMGEVGISRESAILSPCALMMGLYSTHDRCEALKTNVQGGTFTVEPIGNRFSGLGDLPYLSVSARVHPDEKTVDIFVVNRNLESDVACELQWAGKNVEPEVEVATLNGASLHDWNTYKDPDRVGIEESTVESGPSSLDFEFAAHSITRLTLKTE